MNKLKTALLLTALAAFTTPLMAADHSRFSLELEVGPVWQSRNDVEIPNDGPATRFSLEDLVGNGPWPAGRFYFTWNINERHGLRVLLAPLSYTETGIFDDRRSSPARRYAPGVPDRGDLPVQLLAGDLPLPLPAPASAGAGGSVSPPRSATPRSQLQQGDRQRGHRPRLRAAALPRGATGASPSAGISCSTSTPWPAGRAAPRTVALKVGYDIGDRWSVAFGYRTVEGGADVDEVYNFAWFNYAVVSGAYRF